MSRVNLSPFGKVLRRPWYLIWGTLERLFFSQHAYTLQVPFGHRVFTPWFANDADPDFGHALQIVQASGHLAVSPDRCYILFGLARYTLQLGGDWAECGVYTGGTANLLAQLLSQYGHGNKCLHLFDTFTGMPGFSEASRDYHSPNDFSDTSVEMVKARLSRYSSMCQFHIGVMPETFAQVETVDTYSFVHVDVDIYPSAVECCRWFYPRLATGGVMLFDDYGFYPYRNAIKAAVDEFFSRMADRPISLPTGQAVVIKTPI